LETFKNLNKISNIDEFLKKKKFLWKNSAIIW
jgi:hypothetical protein